MRRSGLSEALHCAACIQSKVTVKLLQAVTMWNMVVSQWARLHYDVPLHVTMYQECSKTRQGNRPRRRAQVQQRRASNALNEEQTRLPVFPQRTRVQVLYPPFEIQRGRQPFLLYGVFSCSLYWISRVVKLDSRSLK